MLQNAGASSTSGRYGSVSDHGAKAANRPVGAFEAKVADRSQLANQDAMTSLLPLPHSEKYQSVD